MRVGRVLITAFSVIALAASSASAQVDVTAPGDSIQLVNGVNDGDGNAGPPPGAEGVERAIDDFTQKYLNFLDLGSGFIVTPSVGSTTLGGLRFYTANDAIERDPASYLLEGSNNGTDFTLISEGALALPTDRNAGGTTPAHVIDPLTMFTAYTSYRLTFPTLRDAAAANSMQIGEVEFLSQVPEPSAIVLAGLGLVAVVGARRFRKS
jgi:hypothetical protein